MGNTGQLCTPSWCCPWWIPITVRCSRSTRIIGKQSLEVNILLLKNSNFPMQDKETVSTTQEKQTRQSVLFGTDWNWTIWMKSQLGRTSQGHCRTMNAIIPLSCWEPSYCVRELFSLVQMNILAELISFDIWMLFKLPSTSFKSKIFCIRRKVYSYLWLKSSISNLC